MAKKKELLQRHSWRLYWVISIGMENQVLARLLFCNINTPSKVPLFLECYFTVIIVRLCTKTHPPILNYIFYFHPYIPCLMKSRFVIFIKIFWFFDLYVQPNSLKTKDLHSASSKNAVAYNVNPLLNLSLVNVKFYLNNKDKSRNGLFPLKKNLVMGNFSEHIWAFRFSKSSKRIKKEPSILFVR